MREFKKEYLKEQIGEVETATEYTFRCISNLIKGSDFEDEKIAMLTATDADLVAKVRDAPNEMAIRVELALILILGTFDDDDQVAAYSGIDKRWVEQMRKEVYPNGYPSTTSILFTATVTDN